MSAIADRIAREHQRVFNRPHATCLCGWDRTHTGDQQPFLRHVAEMTEAALLTAEPTEAEVRAASEALHADNCPEDDEHRGCTCGDWDREALIALRAAKEARR